MDERTSTLAVMCDWVAVIVTPVNVGVWPFTVALLA
jgi:hypothetical protein